MTGYDANWLDTCAILAGVLNVIIQKFRKKISVLDVPGMLTELMTGAALPPAIVLTFGALVSSLLSYLLSASRPTLFFAGFATILALLNSAVGPRQQPR